MTAPIDMMKQIEICAIVAVGGSLRTAAKHVGFTVASIRRLAAEDEDFALRLQRAESDFEVIHLSNIRQAGKKSWNASAWLLERVYPERFARRRPRTIPLEQLQDVFDNLAETIKQEVLDAERCQRLIECMTRLLENLKAGPQRKRSS